MIRAEWSNDHQLASAATAWTAGGVGARRRFPSPVLAGAASIALCLLHTVLLTAQTGPLEQAGKHIYASGESPAGSPLEAVLGEGSTTVPATLMPCVSCHGADGRGRPEGGITPSDITWGVLSRPLRSDDRLARNRPAYTVESLRKVVRKGMDPEGNALGIAMPRYNITDADLNSLIAYLKHLGAEIDPGLSSASIRLGTVIPDAGTMAAAGENIAELLRAYFAELNQQGGIYDRKVELEVLRVQGAASTAAAQVDEFIRKQKIFAFVGVLAPGAEREVDEALQKAHVPVIDAFATEREEDNAAESDVYHVLSGLPQQARVLVKYALERPDNDGAPVAVLYPQARRLVAEAVVQECRARSCSLVEPIAYTTFDAAKISSDLRAQKTGTVFFLGTGRELQQLSMSAQSSNWRPLVLQPGPLAGEDVFHIAPEFNERLFFSFPTLPTDIVPVALQEYAFLGRKYNLAALPLLRALSALAPAKVLAEALRQAGRDLSREKLAETLSGMYNFATGWTPPVSYGATRRVGALGAYVVKLNLNEKSFAPVGPWIVP